MAIFTKCIPVFYGGVGRTLFFQFNKNIALSDRPVLTKYFIMIDIRIYLGIYYEQILVGHVFCYKLPGAIFV